MRWKDRIVVAVALLLALACAAPVAFSQAPGSLLLPVWTGTRYVFPSIGPGLVMRDGRIDVLPVPVRTRRYDQVLPYSAESKVWLLPAGASAVVVHVNGLRYRAGVDYSVEIDGRVVALGDGMLPDHQVTADFDVGS